MDDPLYEVYLELRKALANDELRKELDQRVLRASPYNLAGVIFSMCLTLQEPLASELANRVIAIKADDPVWNSYG